MPEPTITTLIPGVPDDTTTLLLSGLGALVVVVAAPVLSFVVRKSLEKAGLRGPRPDEPGVDWGRVAGLVTGFGVLSMGLAVVAPNGLGGPFRTLVGALLSGLAPVWTPLFILAIGDHYRRVLLERAAATKGPKRARLEKQEDRLRVGVWIVAAMVLFGDGLWSAWPLGLGFLVFFAMQDKTVGPLVRGTLEDLRAGRRLRARADWVEGKVLQLDGRSVVLAGAPGWVDTPVADRDGEKHVRNAVLVQARAIAVETDDLVDGDAV